MVDIVSIAPKIFPGSKVINFATYWDQALDYAEINTDNRLRMFLAQCGHECSGFRVFIENMNYTATRLAIVWPNRFGIPARGNVSFRGNHGYDLDGDRVRLFGKTYYKSTNDGKSLIPNAHANQIQGQPELIGNTVYANRMGNGSIASGDGYRYRGHGIKMITGKGMFRVQTQALYGLLKIDYVEHPSKMAEPQSAIMSAAHFWKIKRMNLTADRGYAGLKPNTFSLNGGYIGLRERGDLYNKILSFF